MKNKIWVFVRKSYILAKFWSHPRTEVIQACRKLQFFSVSVDKCHSHACHVISYATPTIFFGCEYRCVQKVEKIVCLTHDILQSVIVSGVVICHISNVNGVLQYTRISALYNTSVIFLAVQNNYLQGQICLSPILRLSSRNCFQLR